MPTFAVLLLLASPSVQDAELSILPELPDGWRTERLAFPLSFAPEIQWRGFEELAFAPGMFDADSESYFSYAFGVRIEEEVELDLATVDAFLDTYYLGLCRATTAGREVDLSGVGADVTLDGHRFRATLEVVDGFVTGEPLTLQCELSVHPRPGGIELFAIVSPRGPEARIWKELRALEVLWRKSQQLPVFLNHVYFVPDAETYAALAGSSFLREAFGANEERDTVRADLSYSGLYVYGTNTYFEFLKPSAAFEPGGTGIAFGVERPGGTEQMLSALGERGVNSFPGAITRELAGEALPWFRILGIEQPHARSRLSLFSLEYDPDFLSRWHPDLPPEPIGIQRRDVLARYAASLGQARLREEGPFVDVTELTLALDAAQSERLKTTCAAFGWNVEGNGAGWKARGPGIRLVVRDSEDPGGVTSIVMRLRDAIEREPLRLGQATLTFEGDRAILTVAR